MNKEITEARPHPTLVEGRNDFDESAFFKAEVLDGAAKISDGKVSFSIKFDCNLESIKGYVSRGALKYGLRMKCPPTSFFEFRETDSESLDVEIAANKVDGDLNLEAYVFAPKEVPRFSPGRLNPDYADHQIFHLAKGAQVAICPLPKIPVRHDIDYTQPLKSLIDIQENDDPEAKFADVKLDEKRLILLLPKDAYDAWFLTRRNRFPLRKPLANILVFPVLVHAIHYLISKSERDLNEELDETKWAKQIDVLLDRPYTLADLKENPSDVYRAIESLLDGPLGETLIDLKEFSEDNDGNPSN